MYLMRNHDVWIYVRCANSDPRIAFDRLYDLIDEAAGHGFLVRGTSFDHCSGNTLKDRIGLRTMLDAVENGRIEAVMVRDLEQISRNSCPTMCGCCGTRQPIPDRCRGWKRSWPSSAPVRSA